jgi:hypothetical protein
MFAIVGCLVIVGIEQALQHFDRFGARRCRMQVTVLFYEMLVPWGDVAATCIAH